MAGDLPRGSNHHGERWRGSSDWDWQACPWVGSWTRPRRFPATSAGTGAGAPSAYHQEDLDAGLDGLQHRLVPAVLGWVRYARRVLWGWRRPSIFRRLSWGQFDRRPRVWRDVRNLADADFEQVHLKGTLLLVASVFGRLKDNEITVDFLNNMVQRPGDSDQTTALGSPWIGRADLVVDLRLDVSAEDFSESGAYHQLMGGTALLVGRPT